MKLSIMVLPFLVATVLAGSPGGTTAISPAEAVIRERVAAFGQAFRDADAAALAAMLTAGYVHTNGGSPPIGREQWLRFIAQRTEELASGRLRLTKYENTDLRVAVHAGCAIVTGVNSSEGVRDGKPFATKLRFTQVWVVEEGSWRRAAFHDTPLP